MGTPLGRRGSGCAGVHHGPHRHEHPRDAQLPEQEERLRRSVLLERHARREGRRRRRATNRRRLRWTFGPTASRSTSAHTMWRWAARTRSSSRRASARTTARRCEHVIERPELHGREDRPGEEQARHGRASSARTTPRSRCCASRPTRSCRSRATRWRSSPSCKPNRGENQRKSG